MIIDGHSIACEIENNIKKALEKLHGRKPGLAFVRVGDDPASIAYLRKKRKKCTEVGIQSFDFEFPSSFTEKQLLEEIARLNASEEIDGILVQLPLPKHIDSKKIVEAIDPLKDIDGFHPLNMGKLLIGQKDGFFPCTPYGIVVLLSRIGIDPKGKHVVILGRSNIVGKPLAALLMQKEKGLNATVTIAHSQTYNLKNICKTADILIAAMGCPKFVTADMVKDGAIVIDVGNTKTDLGMIGDVDFEQVAPKCKHITPVPGGVGPMTIALLLSNTLLSYQRKFSHEIYFP